MKIYISTPVTSRKEQNLTCEHITTKTVVRKSVYMDRSNKYDRNGKRYIHNRWRADVRLLGPDGAGRIRARFSDYNQALRWLKGMTPSRSMSNITGCTASTGSCG